MPEWQCNAVTRCEGAEATLSERIYERDNAVRTAREMARAVLRLTDAMREAVADLACAMPEDAKRRLNAALAATDTALDTGGEGGEWACQGGTRMHCHVFCTCDGSKAEEIDPRL